MSEGPIIKGGAGKFEAAVIAVLIEELEREEKAAAVLHAGGGPALPAWVWAARSDGSAQPMEPWDPRARDQAPRRVRSFNSGEPSA